MNYRLIALFGILLSGITAISSTFTQMTAFTYQGQLSVNGQPANGLYDLEFSLYNAASGGSQVGLTVTNLAVGLTNGMFTVTMNFGAASYNGQALWLAVAACTNGYGVFTPLNPLQPVTSTPYSVHSLNAGTAANVTGPISLAQLPGTVVTNGGNISGNFTGTFNGSGAGLTNLNASQLTTGTVPVFQLPGNIKTNQSFVSSYIASAKLTDQGAVESLNSFMAAEEGDGALQNLQVCIPLVSAFNPSNQIDLLGNSFTMTGKTDFRGLICTGNNGLTAMLPAPLTNGTLVIFYRNPAAQHYATNNAIGGSPSFADLSGISASMLGGELVSTNDGSLAAIGRDSYWQVESVWNSSGTNMVYRDTWRRGGTNDASCLRNGAASNTAPSWYGDDVIAMTFSNNGTSTAFTLWNDARPAVFNWTVGTNVFVSPTNALTPYNQLCVGMDNNFWTKHVPGGTYSAGTNVNFNGYVQAVLVYNSSSPSIVSNAFSDGQYLYNSRSIWIVGGDSEIGCNNASDANLNSGYSPQTNQMTWFLQSAYPRMIVYDEHQPGSGIDQANSMATWLGGPTFYPNTTFALLPRSLYDHIIYSTDWYRNAIARGVSPANTASMFAAWYETNYPDAELCLVEPGWGADLYTSGYLSALYQCASNIEANMPYVNVARWYTIMTSNSLSNASISRDATHPSGTTQAAHYFNQNLAKLLLSIPIDPAVVQAYQ